jgi:hypothetical protein
MAGSRELWLWAGASAVATAGVLATIAVTLDAAQPGFGLWAAGPMVGAYVAMAVALVSFVGAMRDWPFPFSAERPDPRVLNHDDDRVTDHVADGDDQGSGANLEAADDRVIVGEIPREPPAFVKRQTLARLAEAASSGQTAVVCAVTGLRGVGKTQLAAAYARDRIDQGCGLVGWVNAESRGSLLGDLARVADAAGVADPEGDSAESARRLREHLTVRATESLLVFDNAADPDLVRAFLPAAGSTQVVITSTSHAFTLFGTLVDVSEFSRDESLGYLATRTGLDDRDGAAAVAEELGDLPLGLAQASAVIAGQRLAYREYLQRLSDVPVAQLLGRLPGDDYPRATAAALLLNVAAAEADDLSGLTGRLLRIVALLSAEGVRRQMLCGLSSGDQAAMDAALQGCADQSLLTWSVTGEYVIMHRLLSRVLRERDKVSGHLSATREMAMDLLEPQLHDEDDAWARREDGAELAAHIEAIWQSVAGDPLLPDGPDDRRIGETA